MSFAMNFLKNDVLPGLTSQNPFFEKAEISGPLQRFHTPITTETSVLGLVFDKGVVIAADTLGSYGSLARFKNCERILQVNKNVLVGAGGDYADYQYLKELLTAKSIEEESLDDNILIKPASLHCWLTRVLYNRRSKVDPLWNNVLVAGIDKGKPFLGSVDKLGTAFHDEVIATGYGAHIAVPLLRKLTDKKPISQAEAEAAVVKCMEVLYYRDARSFNEFQLAVITEEKSEIRGPLKITCDWSVSRGVCGYE